MNATLYFGCLLTYSALAALGLKTRIKAKGSGARKVLLVTLRLIGMLIVGLLLAYGVSRRVNLLLSAMMIVCGLLAGSFLSTYQNKKRGLSGKSG